MAVPIRDSANAYSEQIRFLEGIRLHVAKFAKDCQHLPHRGHVEASHIWGISTAFFGLHLWLS